MLIQLPKGKSLYDPETFDAIRTSTAALEKRPASAMSGRSQTLRGWLAEKAHRTDVATLKQYVDILPKYLTQRFLSPTRMR